MFIRCPFAKLKTSESKQSNELLLEIGRRCKSVSHNGNQTLKEFTRNSSIQNVLKFMILLADERLGIHHLDIDSTAYS